MSVAQREKLELIFADAVVQMYGERYADGLIARHVSGDVADPSLTQLQQLIDDVARVVDEVERHVDKRFESDYWRSDLLNSVERTRRALNAWREIVLSARQEDGKRTG
jgi:hypothetical protein